jgi:xanthine dehydrogenase molybdopterin-binding subunit B
VRGGGGDTRSQLTNISSHSHPPILFSPNVAQRHHRPIQTTPPQPHPLTPPPSLNPLIDLGQVEGGFVMGVGYWLTEQLLFAPDGALLSDGTWEYKIPSVLDIPARFNTSLARDRPNPQGFLSSKGTPPFFLVLCVSLTRAAVGEPPMCLAMGLHFAVKNAVLSARADAGVVGDFTLRPPPPPLC